MPNSERRILRVLPAMTVETSQSAGRERFAGAPMKCKRQPLPWKVIWQRLNLSTLVRPNDIVSRGPSTLRTRWASWRLAVAVAQRRNRETHWFLVPASNGYSMMITANRDVQTWAPKTVLALTQPHTGSWCCRKDN